MCVSDNVHSREDISISSGGSLPDMQRSLRRKRTPEFPDNPTLWSNKTIPFIFVEPFSEFFRIHVVM